MHCLYAASHPSLTRLLVPDPHASWQDCKVSTDRIPSRLRVGSQLSEADGRALVLCHQQAKYHTPDADQEAAVVLDKNVMHIFSKHMLHVDMCSDD